MAHPLGRHHLTTVPAYGLITLRDQDNDAEVGLAEAVTRAATAAAGTGYQLLISCAQDLLPVSVTVETWPGPPPADPAPTTWSTPLEFTLECPSGHLELATPTGRAVAVPLTAGPGLYALDLTHRGRGQADTHRHNLLARQDTPLHEAIAEHGTTPIEQYRVRMWLTGPLPDEDDEDDEDVWAVKARLDHRA